MWLKWLCLLIFAQGVVGEDAFLSHLYGVEGRNRVTVCLKPPWRVAGQRRRGRECSGALLHGEIVGVRAGCLRQHPPGDMVVLRLTHGETCDDMHNEYSSIRSRGAVGLYFHPWADLALIYVRRPYYYLDFHPNSTAWTASRTFKKHGIWKWVKQYIIIANNKRDMKLHYSLVQQNMLSTRSPLLLFLVTILLPPMLLLLVFYYIMNYTGNSDEIPYKNLQYTY